MYGELVELDTGVKGMVMNLARDSVGVVLLGSEAGVREGTVVRRTGRAADVPVGDGLIGRVVDVLGQPIDGLGPIETTETRPIEHEASGVVSREPVNVPLQTGILAIDSMFPIGRGQRELIIGDRQTGKTAIAVDTILNQKGQEYPMVYERTLGDEKYVVIVNPGVKAASLNISSVGGKAVSVLSTGKVVYKSGKKTDVIKASGISAAIFKVER